MKLWNFKFVTTALFLVLTLFAAGCAAHSTQTEASDAPALESKLAALDEISGTWTLDRADDGDTGEALPLEEIELQTLDLRADGAAVVTDANGAEQELSFSVEDGVFTLVQPDGSETHYSYAFEDRMLILTATDDDAPALILTYQSVRI